MFEIPKVLNKRFDCTNTQFAPLGQHFSDRISYEIQSNKNLTQKLNLVCLRNTFTLLKSQINNQAISQATDVAVGNSPLLTNTNSNLLVHFPARSGRRRSSDRPPQISVGRHLENGNLLMMKTAVHSRQQHSTKSIGFSSARSQLIESRAIVVHELRH